MSFVPDTQNKEFQDALNLIQYTRQSVFLTGKAGTGKSTFLKYVCEVTKKKHIVLAPTGIAAINAGGSTLHSFFKLPFYPLLPDDPKFSLKEGTYDEVQQVTLTSATDGTIYYTTDGSDPTESSTEYKEAVLLQSEGDTEIRAIAVNKKGIPSAVSSAKYSIEFPLVDAPAVSPSTGQYSTATQITITVPDGYTAYYTMDGSTPTASSEKYTDPIDMPENSQTTFSAILVNDKNGKATEATTRNYITTY